MLQEKSIKYQSIDVIAIKPNLNEDIKSENWLNELERIDSDIQVVSNRVLFNWSCLEIARIEIVYYTNS